LDGVIAQSVANIQQKPRIRSDLPRLLNGFQKNKNVKYPNLTNQFQKEKHTYHKSKKKKAGSEPANESGFSKQEVMNVSIQQTKYSKRTANKKAASISAAQNN